MNAVIYATTGGASRSVARLFAADLADVALIDLKVLASPPPGRIGLLVLGTPTYGLGDWHFAWEKGFARIQPWLAAADRVTMFGLGDARFHGETFCGGIGRLHDAVASTGKGITGATPADVYAYKSTPSLRDGVFPGLCLDWRQSRGDAEKFVNAYLNEFGLPAQSDVRLGDLHVPGREPIPT
jgi:flavodoxin I